jgi:hypothetical protein
MLPLMPKHFSQWCCGQVTHVSVHASSLSATSYLWFDGTHQAESVEGRLSELCVRPRRRHQCLSRSRIARCDRVLSPLDRLLAHYRFGSGPLREAKLTPWRRPDLFPSPQYGETRRRLAAPCPPPGTIRQDICCIRKTRRPPDRPWRWA